MTNNSTQNMHGKYMAKLKHTPPPWARQDEDPIAVSWFGYQKLERFSGQEEYGSALYTDGTVLSDTQGCIAVLTPEQFRQALYRIAFPNPRSHKEKFFWGMAKFAANQRRDEKRNHSADN